ncbi:MAG TPA: AAA family ATPase [Methanomassiliicoccales archaeon]|nr:AAA family ATPase [Methanomassiliicoccales archaeon]
MRITISGMIGSGKTTVCRMLGDILGYRTVISGHVFREMAKEFGMSLEEFGDLAETDPKYDKLIDERLLDVARNEENVILEGRLAGQMLRRNSISAFCIFLDAPLEVRVERVSGREGVDMKAAMEEMRAREASEVLRYRKFYGIDVTDRSIYDMVIDTGPLTPEQVVESIVSRVRGG